MQQKESLPPHPVPEFVLLKMGSDIFEYASQNYLLVVDYFSKYLEVILLHYKSALSVQSVLISIFSRHGIPEKVTSDNVPFASRIIRNFATEWGYTFYLQS